MAVRVNRPDVIALLIEEFSADVELEIADDGASLLFEAVYMLDAAAIEQLLKYGACVNHRDWYGRTPLFMAVVMQKSIMVELLVRHGANVNLLAYPDLVTDAFVKLEKELERLREAKKRCINLHPQKKKQFVACVSKFL